MTSEQFNEVVSKFRAYQDEILNLKKGEYAQGEDRLINFRSVSLLEGRRMSQVATTLLLNHIQRISSQINTGEYTWAMWSGGKEGLKQKIVDAMNYLYLLAACVEAESLLSTSEALEENKTMGGTTRGENHSGKNCSRRTGAD